jgi:hypothetical protein
MANYLKKETGDFNLLPKHCDTANRKWILKCLLQSEIKTFGAMPFGYYALLACREQVISRL